MYPRLAEKLPNNWLKHIQELSNQLAKQLGEGVTVGAVEVRDSGGEKLKDFERLLDDAVAGYDKLLGKRYGKVLIKKAEELDKNLLSIKNYSQSGEAELEQKARDAEKAFSQAESDLNNSLTQMEYNLCSLAIESITHQTRSALSDNINSLKQACKSNQLNEVVTEIIRPALQTELNRVVQTERQQLETSLDNFNATNLAGVHITITLPEQQDSVTSMLSESIVPAILTWVITKLPDKFKSLLILMSSLVSELANQKVKERQFEEQVREQVIPRAVSQVIALVSNLLQQEAKTLRQTMMESFGQQRHMHLQTISQIKKEQAEEQQAFEVRIREYDAALEHLGQLKVTLATTTASEP